MKQINSLLRKCKTLSRQLSRTSSYSSLRSKSTGHHHRRRFQEFGEFEEPYNCETIFVGNSRRRYVIRSEYLNHPLLNALIEKSKPNLTGTGTDLDLDLSVKCEVVLFDHLLWMLENADPNFGSDSLEELAELYIY